MTRVIIAGSRSFNNTEIFNNAITDKLSNIPKKELEIVSGHARGADMMGEQYAKKHDIKCAVFPAKWDLYGKRAGMLRNEEMAKYAAESERGMLIAFPTAESKGTRNMIKLANQYGLEAYVYES